MADAPKRPRRFLQILGYVGLAAVVGAGGAGGYWWWQHQTAAAAADGESAPAAETAPVDAGGALLTFEPFLVNLAGGGSQFLRTKVQLVIADEHLAKEIEEEPVAFMRLRSALLELLAEQSADTLVTADGKAALKKAIQERASRIAGVPVVDVLFSDFVVQF